MKKKSLITILTLIIMLFQIFSPLVIYAVENENSETVTFASQELQSYLLNNGYDADYDGKITKTDMEKIEFLSLGSISLSDLTGLEYATNLKDLYLSVRYQNYGEEINYNFSALTKLTSLKSLTIWGESYRVDILDKLTNLESLTTSLSHDLEQTKEQITQIAALKNLKILRLTSGQVTSLEELKVLSKLEELSIEGLLEKVENWNILGDFTNLKSLQISLNQYSYQNTYIDYQFVKKLTNLEILNIRDNMATSIDIQNFANATKLSSLTINAKELTNIDTLSNLTNLQYLSLDACKVQNIAFMKNLKKLTYMYMANNFITDLSPLEELDNPLYMDFTNNPVGEIDAKYVKISLYITNGWLQLTDATLLENLTFENEEFKNQLINNGFDFNKDGELSKYDMSKIEYLYPNYCIENMQYATNLRTLTINYSELTQEEQKKFIEQINLIGEDVNLTINSLTINLGNIPEEQTYMDLYEALPIIKEIQNSESRIYMDGIINIEEYDDYDVAEIKDEKIYFSTTYGGDANYTIKFANSTSSIYLYLKWKKVVNGNNTKEITIEDPALKAEILENHDMDSDGKITEYDMVNISTLDISERGVKSLKGLEYAKNLTDLYAFGNKIKDISPIVAIGKNGWYDLEDNEITDITCLANSKLDETLDIYLLRNYIDLSEGSDNLKVLKAEYEKTHTSDGVNTFINSIICSQKYGKPEEVDKEVTLDSKIKQKLIQYGIDANNDNKLTRRELYNADRYISEDVDLSGLGLTNIKGLEYLMVYNLNLSNNQLTDITPLTKNKYIGKINLSNNKIKDISCFANNNNFFWGKMDFSNNQIEDISSIKTWPIIKGYENAMWGGGGGPSGRRIEIDLSNNNIKDIAPAKDFINITKLNLSNNNITNIEPLGKYNFTCCEFEDGEVWEDLESFEGIILDGNYININAAGNKKAINVFTNKGVILSLKNQKQKDVSTVFTDVKKTDWYYTAVQYSYNNSMISGLNDTTFGPNQTLTRAMLVTILHRMEGMPYVSGLSKFPDVQNTSAYYYVAVKWATANNIITGYNNGKFGPEDPITREQLAVILNNYCKYKGQYKTVYSNLSDYKDSSQISEFAKWGMNWAVGSGVITGTKEKTLNPKGTATRAETTSMLYKYCLNMK